MTTNVSLFELLKGEGVWSVVGITLDRGTPKYFILSTTNYTSTAVASQLGLLILKPTTSTKFLRLCPVQYSKPGGHKTRQGKGLLIRDEIENPTVHVVVAVVHVTYLKT